MVKSQGFENCILRCFEHYTHGLAEGFRSRFCRCPVEARSMDFMILPSLDALD